MFDFIFSFFITLAVNPEKITVHTYDDVRVGVVDRLREVNHKLPFFVPKDLVHTYDNVKPFIDGYFETKSASGAKVVVYTFKHSEIASDDTVLNAFTAARRFAAVEYVRESLSGVENEDANLGLRFCFARQGGGDLSQNLLKYDAEISDGSLQPELTSRCFAHYWGRVTKSATGELFLSDRQYKAKSNDQYVAIYQQKTGRLLVVMAGANPKEVYEVFAIENFDKQSQPLMNFIQMK